jgi:Ni/Co efflux regulator RcnB
MVAPIVGTTARKLYRDARGKFISKAKWELEQRRDPATGRLRSKAWANQRLDKQKVENYLRAQLGAPPAGKQWSQIAAKYPQRFADFLEDV